MNEDYKYEVAFSFLQEDEQLALEIADRIRDRLNVGIFVYSERQDELAGTDGVEKFSKIFAEESRIVMILYREGWGQTRWTRVEETAIRTRGFDEGHEFVLLVNLDATSPPRWLPPTRLYLGFERYGIDGIVSAIESRVQGAGGTIVGVSAVDHAAKIARNLSFNDERTAWLDSEKAVNDADLEVETLINEFERITREVNKHVKEIQIVFGRPEASFCSLSIKGVSLGVTWHRTFANNLNRSGLGIILSTRRPSEHDIWQTRHLKSPQFVISWM